MNKLLLIVGESGAGKTAVSNYLEETQKKVNNYVK